MLRTRPVSTTEIQWISFEDAQKKMASNPKKIFVDVYTYWCGPCKMIAPLLNEVADEFDGKITVAKLNVDENNETPPKYGIRGIPTLLLFKEGNVVGTKVGALSKSQLVDFINENV